MRGALWLFLCLATAYASAQDTRHPARLIVRFASDIAVTAAAVQAAGTGSLRLVAPDLSLFTVRIKDGSKPETKAKQLSELPGVLYAEVDLMVQVAGAAPPPPRLPRPPRPPPRPPRPPRPPPRPPPPPPRPPRPPRPPPRPPRPPPRPPRPPPRPPRPLASPPLRRTPRRPSIVIPNDTYWSQQWGPAMMNAPMGWGLHRDARSVRVCVVDSGVKWDHPDLAASLVPMSADYQALHWDGYGHGTHVAGIIGAVSSNGRGITGTSFRTSLLACKALNDQGSGYVSDVVACIDSCRSLGASIINLSITLLPGLLPDNLRSLNASLQASTQHGVLVVSAAGNSEIDLDWTPVYPGSFAYPGLLAVANIRRDAMLQPTDYDSWPTVYGSNYGFKSVQVAAPGTNILSTSSHRLYNGDYYQYMTGTSMAAPAVSGVAALALAASEGKLSNVELEQLLIRTSRPLPALAGKVVSEGVVDMYRALREAMMYA